MIFSTCVWVRSRLPLLAGGDVLGLDHRRVERHLLRCPSCRTRLADLRASQAVLARAAVVDPTAPATATLWPALAEQIRANPRPSVRSAWTLHPTRRRRSWAWAVPAAALAAGALLTIGLVLARDHLSPRRPSRNVVVKSQFYPRKSPRLLKDDAQSKPEIPRSLDAPPGQPTSFAPDLGTPTR